MLETPRASAIPFANTVFPLPRVPESAIIDPGTSFKASFFPASRVSSVEQEIIDIS